MMSGVVRIINWRSGQASEVPNEMPVACVDFILPDGRTMQMVGYTDGQILVRAWIHPPGEGSLDGNKTYFSVSATLPPALPERSNA